MKMLSLFSLISPLAVSFAMEIEGDKSPNTQSKKNLTAISSFHFSDEEDDSIEEVKVQKLPQENDNKGEDNIVELPQKSARDLMIEKLNIKHDTIDKLIRDETELLTIQKRLATGKPIQRPDDPSEEAVQPILTAHIGRIPH